MIQCFYKIFAVCTVDKKLFIAHMQPVCVCVHSFSSWLLETAEVQSASCVLSAKRYCSFRLSKRDVDFAKKKKKIT